VLEGLARAYKQGRKVHYVLPALIDEWFGRDGNRPTLQDILNQWNGIGWADHSLVVTTHREQNPTDRTRIDELVNGCAGLSKPPVIYWLQSPQVSELYDHIRKSGVTIDSRDGKAKGYFIGIGAALAMRGEGDYPLYAAHATHDCDIKTPLLRLVAEVAYPLVGHEAKRYDVSKANYVRIHNGELKGRVSRNFFRPFISAILSHYDHPMFRFLQNIEYPLSGEVGFSRDIAENLELAQGYGLETGQNLRMFRYQGRITQPWCGVYDHHHQTNGALGNMVAEITDILIAALVRLQGVDVTDLGKLHESYIDRAVDYVSEYHLFAAQNGLRFNEDNERGVIVNDFAPVLQNRIEEWRHGNVSGDSVRGSRMPSWHQIFEKAPHANELLARAAIKVR